MPFSTNLYSVLDRTSLFHQGRTKEKLEINSSDSEADLVNGYVIYKGGIKATYGPTILTSDTLIVRQGKPGDPAVEINIDGKAISLRPLEAYAIGQVKIIDPDGTMQASNLWFTWDSARRNLDSETVIRADNVAIHIESADITGATMAQSKAGIEVKGATFKSGNWRTPLYEFEADNVLVVPGKKATAKGVHFSFLGIRLPAIPRFVISLDPRESGIQIPRIGYRQGAGLGVSWSGDYLVNESSDVSGSFAAYPKVQPTYGLTYAKSNVPPENAAINQFAITDQLGERSEFSHFSNIYVNSLDEAYTKMRIPKDLFSVGTSFNIETLGRVTDRKVNYTRPLEIGYEKGGPVGDWGYLLQAKASRIIEAGSLSANRLMLQANVFTPIARSGNFVAATRFDGSTRFDTNSSGYLGAESGLSYHVWQDLCIGAGVYGYKNFGTNTFQADAFVSNQGYVVRGDLIGSATKLSLMYRYDPSLGWFDREYRVSQIMGPIEPVLVFRESPRHYELGFIFRTDGIAKILRKRQFNRDTTNSTDKSQ